MYEVKVTARGVIRALRTRGVARDYRGNIVKWISGDGKGIPRYGVNGIFPNVIFKREQQQVGVDEAEPACLVDAIFLALSSALDDSIDLVG
jgi:hypothetical protein